MDKKMLVVCGPTATGKTQLALQLAQKYNGELISADSRQVYRGMDIGTGKDLKLNTKYQILNTEVFYKNTLYKISAYDIDGVNVWLYDVVNPDEEFSVDHYFHLATHIIEDIRKRRKLPILVGGTGLYISSLLSPIETSHIPPNQVLRNELEQKELIYLQERLKKVDPLAWERMNISDQHNPRRLIRKIEIASFYCHPGLDPGSRLSQREPDFCSWQERHKDVLLLGLKAPYHYLYQRIDDRVEKRVREGIVKEIQTLMEKGYSWDLPSLNTFGYKEWREYVQSPAIQERIIQRWKWDEHGYARRQMTWFRKMKGISWVDISRASWREKVESLVNPWYTSRCYAVQNRNLP